MKKIYLISALALALGLTNLRAQQLPHFTQYMFNDYVLNPAIGGTHEYYQVKTNYRYQWFGIKDAPRTYMLSAYGPHKSMPMGYGGYIFSDVTGPIHRLGAYGSYAYNLRLTGDIRLSMGMFLGFYQYKIDVSSIKFGSNDNDQMDPVEANGDKFTKLVPDATLGVYLYTSQYFAGISAHQLFGNKIEPVDSVNVDQTLQRLKRHYYIIGGYKYNINRDFDIEPSVLFKGTYGAPLQMDINAKVIWQKIVWAGLTFRTNDAIAVIAGYNYNDMINIGVSYDITISPIRKYAGGTFEVLIGIKFNKIKQGKSTRRLR